MGEQSFASGRRRQTAAEQRQAKIKLWMNRITRARTLRREWEEKYRVDELAALYLGESDATLSINDTEEPKVNRFWPTIKAMLPGFISQAPSFTLRSPPKARTELSTENAMVGESVLNAIARQDGALEQAAKLATLQAFWRMGVLKAVYDPSPEPNPRRGEPIFLSDTQGNPVIDEVTGLPAEILDPETGEPMVEPNEIMRDEVYEWQWVNAANMLLPDAGPDRTKWPWIGEEITVDLEDAKEDERFPKRLRDKLQENRVNRSGNEQPEEFPLMEGMSGEHEKEVTYVELWDHKAKEHLILVEGQSFQHTDFLLDEDVPDGIEKNPYSLLIFNPIIDPKPSPWPLPMTWNWRPVQKELHIRRQQMMAAAGRSARKVGYDENTFKNADEAVAALRSTTDMEAVLLGDVNRPWITVPDPSSTPDITRDYAILTDDWRTVTGATGARLNDPDSDTATEAVLSEQAATLRDVLERGVVQMWMSNAGKKMLQLLQATLTLGVLVKLRGFNDREVQEYITRVYGAQAVQALRFAPALRRQIIDRIGNEQWTRVTREDLQFEADVLVAPGSMRARTLDSERQQLLAFIRLIAQAPIITLFPELLRTLGDMFEFIDDRIIEEMAVRGPQILQALAQGGQSGSSPTPSVRTNGSARTSQQLGARLAGALLSGGVG